MGFGDFLRGLLGIGGYEAAAPSNHLRKSAAYRRSFPKDEDSHAKWARGRLRLEAHDMDRNHGMFFGVCNRIADYTVPRVVFTAATGSEEWDRAARAYLRNWFRKADLRGRDSFPRLVWLALRTSLLDGDGAFVFLSNGQLLPVEAELIGTPEGPALASAAKGVKIVDGVEVDAVGRAVAYWIAPRDPGGIPDRSRARRFPARAEVFWAHRFRFDTVRGIPPTSPILADLRDQKDLHVSYLAKVRNDVRHGVVASLTDGGSSIPGNMLGLSEATGEEADSAEELPAPGVFEDDELKMWTVRPGENVQVLQPGTPSASIVEYEANAVRMMSAALGIPAEFWTLDLRGLSWSTANAVVKIAGDAFRALHEWAAAAIIRPVLDWRLLMAIQDGDLPPAPVAELPNGEKRSLFDSYRLSPPEYLWAAEREHYEAARLGQQLGLPVMARLAGEIGMTFDELLERRKEELKKLYLAAAEVSAATGAPVSVSQFMDATTPGQQGVPAASPEGEKHDA